MIAHDLSVAKPDYHGRSIVNLMSSIGSAFGAALPDYAPLTLLPEARLREAHRVVLLVIDGLGEELLMHIGNNGTLEGLHCGRMTSVYPPTTASAIATFMTGQAPQQHAMTGWFMHLRKLGAVTAVLPFIPRYGVQPLSATGVDMGTLIDCSSFFDRIDAASVCLMPAYIADSDFSRLFGGRSRRVPYKTLDDFATMLQAYCSGTQHAGYVYAYWPELDRLAHEHGPSHELVADHFRELDAALAPAVAACARNGTLLIATADHGFIDSGDTERIDLDDHPELAAMLSLPLSGEPRSTYCYVRASCIDEFEAYVRAELADVVNLVRSEQLLADGWFGLGQPHPELCARIGDYTMQMLGRSTMRDLVIGERDIRMNGMHGGITAAEQYVPLFVAGP